MNRFLAYQFARPSGWLGRWRIGPWLDRIGRPMNRLALEKLDLQQDETILEVGFGGGDLLASLLAIPVAAVGGVDRSDAMVKRAERRFRKEIAAGRLIVHVGSAERLPLPEARFDKACSVNTLYFWPDPAAVLAELARVLRPAGCVVLCFQTPEAVCNWPGHRYGFHAYGADRISGLMEAAGFHRPSKAVGRDPRLGEYVCLSSRKI